MWADIPDAEGYEASHKGEIRNKKTGRILKQFVGKDGYLRIQIAGKSRVVHRLIANTYLVKPIGKDFVNHMDGNKQHNNVGNLEWVTRSENMVHAYSHGLKDSKGTNNGRSKLKMSDVVFIRKNYVPGDKKFGATALAKKYGVARQTISAVANGQNWGGE